MAQFRRSANRRFVQPFGRTATTRTRPSFHLPKIQINWLVIVGVILLSIGVWYVFGSGHFKVSTIIIQGSLNDSVSNELQSLKGKNIVLLSVGRFEDELPKRQSSIKLLRIVKGFPDTLKIDVSVRAPALVWKTGDTQYYVDTDGVAFTLEGTETKVDNASLMVLSDSRLQPVVVGQKLLTNSFVQFVTQLSGKFRDKTGINVTGVSVGETLRFIDVTTDTGLTIKFDTTRELEPQLIALTEILTKYKTDIRQYVDLRIEGRVFYQ